MSEIQKAYIAGFLDGDGSLMLQFKPRKSVNFGFRAKTTVCFYQNSRYKDGVEWIQKKLGRGYLSTRKDNITELRIEGHQQVKDLLLTLEPYIIFKKKQVQLMLKAISILQQEPDPKEFLQVCKLSDQMSKLNYATTKKKYDYNFVKKELVERGLIPP